MSGVPTKKVLQSVDSPLPVDGDGYPIQDLIEIRDLSKAERQDLLDGPKVKILVGKTLMGTVPLRFLLAISSTIQDQYQFFKHMDNLTLSENINPDAVAYILEWLSGTMRTQKAYYLPVIHTISRDLLVVQAGRAMGIDHYVQHIEDHYWYQLWTKIPTHEELNVIEKLAPDAQDRLLVHISDRVGNLHFNGQLPAGYKLDWFLASHPKMAVAVKNRIKYLVEDHRQYLKRVEKRERREKFEKEQAARLQ
ncbi:hypothetical protein P154DRAFT_581529 [Amniculicola lignicola CBS 123094]|uniref:BTB domain-containing protein n=1 Tax=Amniculicola lignicola CBS 123094 TaxID=1392246 RepID=A0A6A5VY80_9PLEO|nr:hypothetical protein P154DRAFT_581529 [Amniculicola lignicola CBS 123094]